MNIEQYISKDTMILIPFLYCVGLFLKSSELPDRYIPLSLLGISIAFCIMIIGFNYLAIIQGVFIASTTVFGNQVYKQQSKKS